MNCPLCGFEFDETAMTCASACPMAAVQGCNLLCCPNCGYQMVDERKSGLAQLLRRALKVVNRVRPSAGQDRETD
jgi:predicted Zn-ribbon and HTH transcriptional regulator